MQKVLIISEYIAPMQAVGSIRWTKLGKYLAKNEGCQITVLTDQKDFCGKQQDGNWQRYDATLAGDRQYFHRVYEVPNNAFMRFYYRRKNKRLRAAQGGGTEIKGTLSPQNKSFWKQAALDVSHRVKDDVLAQQAKQFLKGIPWDFDVIISTYGPIWPHLVAEHLKKRYPQALWLADYRDMCYEPGKCVVGKHYYQSFAQKHTKTADGILMANMDMEQGLSLPHGQPSLCLTNGFDPEDKQPAEQAAQFYLVYTGVLYGVGEMQRDLSPVFRALKQLEQEGTARPDEVQVCYAGGDSVRFLEQAEACGAAAFAKDLGVLPRAEALRWQQCGAVLLMCTWNTKRLQGMVTAKLYEYMMAQKPVLATVTGDVPNSRLKQMMQETNLGFCCEAAGGTQDFSDMVDFLRGAICAWKLNGTVPFTPYVESVNGFSHPRLAHSLAQWIETIKALPMQTSEEGTR